jgi:hypothetical protein
MCRFVNQVEFLALHPIFMYKNLNVNSTQCDCIKCCVRTSGVSTKIQKLFCDLRVFLPRSLATLQVVIIFVYRFNYYIATHGNSVHHRWTFVFIYQVLPALVFFDIKSK